MPLVAKARSFLRNLFFTQRVDEDLDQEVRSHLQLLTEENVRAGMPRKEAERAARMELGGAEQVKEQRNVVRGSHWGRKVDASARTTGAAVRGTTARDAAAWRR